MAEIDIKKKDPSVWPWVVLGLILLAIGAWYLFLRPTPLNTPSAVNSDSVAASSDSQMGSGASESTGGAMPAAVMEFNRFAEAQTSTATGPSHEYTADGIEKLADAIDAVVQKRAVSGVNVSQVLSEMRARADSLRSDPNSTAHARKTREAFLLASGLIMQIQGVNYPSLASSTTELNDAALAVKVEPPLLEQTAEVNRFFSNAASTLNTMYRSN